MRNHRQFISSAFFFVGAFACASGLFADATVTRGSGPNFPLEADGVLLFVWRGLAGAADSSVTALPLSVYTELRENIDSVYNYATALKLRRKELSGCEKGPKYGACLSVTTLGTATLKVFFLRSDFRSGKILTATDRSPFVVIFTKGFSEKLKRLAKSK
jgi:hypothetical protein